MVIVWVPALFNDSNFLSASALAWAIFSFAYFFNSAIFWIDRFLASSFSCKALAASTTLALAILSFFLSSSADD